MILPESFFFSQNKLQDYLDCPRRFELKHILKQEWPAIQSEPVRELENHILLGNQFHLFVQQYFNQVSPELILSQSTDPILNTWWTVFEKYMQTIDIHHYFSEIQLSSQINGHRFIGIIDLLVFDKNGNIVIYDWKTNKNKPSPTQLLSRIQTKLYPIMIKYNAFRFEQNNFNPENLTMTYWFVNSPNHPISFTYTKAQLEENKKYLTSLINRITETDLGEFPLTPDSSKCKFCNYRSLCSRGEKAGVLEEFDNYSFLEDDILELNFDSLSELEY